MKKQKTYFLFDHALIEYKSYYKEKSEEIFILDLKKYLPDLSKTSEVTLITSQKFEKVNEWLSKNGLNEFVDCISRTTI